MVFAGHVRFSMTIRSAVAQDAIPLSSLMSFMILSLACGLSLRSTNCTISSNAVLCDATISRVDATNYQVTSSPLPTLLSPVSAHESYLYFVHSVVSPYPTGHLIPSQASH